MEERLKDSLRNALDVADQRIIDPGGHYGIAYPLKHVEIVAKTRTINATACNVFLSVSPEV